MAGPRVPDEAGEGVTTEGKGRGKEAAWAVCQPFQPRQGVPVRFGLFQNPLTAFRIGGSSRPTRHSLGRRLTIQPIPKP